MCLGTKHIHDKRVLHRDLKSKVKKKKQLRILFTFLTDIENVLHIFILYEMNISPHLTSLQIHISRNHWLKIVFNHIRSCLFFYSLVLFISPFHTERLHQLLILVHLKHYESAIL